MNQRYWWYLRTTAGGGAVRPVSQVYAVRMAGMSGPAKMYSVYCPPRKWIRYSSLGENS